VLLLNQGTNIISEQSLSEQTIKLKEQIIQKLTEFYLKHNVKQLLPFVTSASKVLGDFPKARQGKILKSVLDLTIAQDSLMAVELCAYLIGWCTEEKRSYLRYRVQLRLAVLQLELSRFRDALDGVLGVMEEVRKADDKMLLVEIELVD